MESKTRVRSPLISADSLRASLGTTKVFDVRGTWSGTPRSLREEYEGGHVPGARFLDWTSTFLDAELPLDLAPLSSPDDAERCFRELGLHAGDEVVLYDDYRHMFAGRIWWAMRCWGFESVRVLDGGWSEWVSRGHAISTASTEHEGAGTYVPTARPELRKTLNDIHGRSPDIRLLDGRGPKSYAGRAEDPRTGHIPGAISVAHTELLDERGCFLADERLRSLFEEKVPAWRSARIVSSCGAGYSGTVPMLALAHLGVASSLYDGSFAEWKADPARPVAQGAE